MRTNGHGGGYQVLADEDIYKRKRIVVYPCKSLSLQRHQHRDGHRFVLSGQAMLSVDDNEIILTAEKSVDIPRKAIPRIENTGSENLAFIEAQTGNYFGEDDIERLEDDFGRI